MYLKALANKRIDKLLEALECMEEDIFMKGKQTDLGMRSTTANAEMKVRHERGQAIPAADIVSHCNFCHSEQSHITVIYFDLKKVMR